jgi:hypothetical protein
LNPLRRYFKTTISSIALRSKIAGQYYLAIDSQLLAGCVVVSHRKARLCGAKATVAMSARASSVKTRAGQIISGFATEGVRGVFPNARAFL